MTRAITRSPRAALLLGAGLDRYLPMLRAARDTGRSAAVDGCDVLDQLPLLCIGGTGDNVYTADAALLIDEGGNDNYANGAGAAPFLPAGQAAYTPVSIVVDESGNDVYAPADPARSYRIGAFTYSLLVADAAGATGGVGIVVDEAGDDTHTIAVPAPASKQPGLAVVQGAGLGGVGILLDGAGTDTHTATAPDGHQDGITVVGQGATLMTYRASPDTGPGLAAGVDVVPAGAIVDRGASDDTYAVDAGVDSVDSAKDQGWRGALVQGYALVGSGLVADDGGKDAFSVQLGASRTDRTTYPDASGNYAAPQATINAQGFGLGPVFGNTTAPKGYGMIVEGDGPTTYRLEARGVGMAQVQAWGQSWAGGDGFATIDDRSGDDTYDLRGTLDLTRTINVDDTCGCDTATATVDGYRALPSDWVSGQGASGFTSESILHDRAGNDTYLSLASEDMDVSLHDGLSAPAGPGSLDVQSYGPMALQVQGYGGGGEGVLIDEAGTDTYSAHSQTSTDASGDSSNGSVPMVTALASAKSDAKGQGAGGWLLGNSQLGALLDLGGTGDRFDAASSNTVSTEPDPAGALQSGWYWPEGFQGNGFDGLFVANGDDPSIHAAPAEGVCPGSPGLRGFGDWFFCGTQGDDPDHQVYDGTPGFVAPLPNVWAAGHAPNAAGRAPSLTFAADTPATGTAESRLPVSAVLRGPDGQPLSGVPVRFDLQIVYPGLVPQPQFMTYLNLWEADAVTAADGTAVADLPVALQRYNLDPTTLTFRLMATFDGADGVYPAHVVRDVSIVPAS